MSDFTCITQWGEDARRERERESDKHREWARKLEQIPVTPYCLKCGMSIELVRAYGRVWHFDARTERIHVCKYVRPDKWSSRAPQVDDDPF